MSFVYVRELAAFESPCVLLTGVACGAESFAAPAAQNAASSATPIAALCAHRFILDPRCNNRPRGPTHAPLLFRSAPPESHLPARASSQRAALDQSPHTNCRSDRDRSAYDSHQRPPPQASSARDSRPPDSAAHPAAPAGQNQTLARASESARPIPTGPGKPAKTPPAPRYRASPAVRSPESWAHTDSKSGNPPAQKTAPQLCPQKPSVDRQPSHRDRPRFLRQRRCGRVQTHEYAQTHATRIEKERQQSGFETQPEWSRAHDPCAPAPLRHKNGTARHCACLTQLEEPAAIVKAEPQPYFTPSLLCPTSIM